MKKVKNVSDEQILFDCLVLAWDDTQKWGGPFSYQCFATSSTKMILVETQACLCKFCIPLLACVTESKPANIHGLLTLKKLMHPFTHPVVVLVLLQILLKRRWSGHWSSVSAWGAFSQGWEGDKALSNCSFSVQKASAPHLELVKFTHL